MTPPIPPEPPAPIRHALGVLARGADLTEAESAAVFGAMIDGRATAAEVAGVLMALAAKGEVAAEVAGAARALRSAMVPLPYHDAPALVDTCGTGGGVVTTLNISTAAAFIVAGAGIPVAKHGNRSFTSRSGSADVLEALRIAVDASPGRAAEVLADTGIAFLFAPTYHPAMRHVGPVRRELGVPTIMNLIGPLANPAGVTRQVIGVAERARGRPMAEALLRLGSHRAMVVHGMLGLDEIAPVGKTLIWEVDSGAVREWEFDAAELELGGDTIEGLAGGEPADNARAIEQLFRSPDEAAPVVRAAVLLNAAAAIAVGTDGATFAESMVRARVALEQGRAAERLDALRRASPLSTSG